jgi:hypothetical protein
MEERVTFNPLSYVVFPGASFMDKVISPVVETYDASVRESRKYIAFQIKCRSVIASLGGSPWGDEQFQNAILKLGVKNPV